MTPEKNTLREQLIDGLKAQEQLMIKNAALMEQLHPESSHVGELAGAARITRDWIIAIRKEDEPD